MSEHSHRIARLGKRALGWALLAAFAVGPPALALASSWGEPLYATRTVETTQSYGIIPSVVPVVLVWGMIVVVAFGMASGRFPTIRRFR